MYRIFMADYLVCNNGRFDIGSRDDRFHLQNEKRYKFTFAPMGPGVPRGPSGPGGP